MKIEKLSKDKEKISFLIRGINNTIANSIRRSVLEIPVLAIDTVEFYKNDSAFYDEMIAHRLGLLPLRATKTFTPKHKCSCKGKGCLKCSAALNLKAKGPGMVYAKTLKSRAVEIIYPEMPIIFLDKEQQLELSAEASLGMGKEHAKFTPGIVWFNSFPLIEIKGCDGCAECIKLCPRKAMSVEGKKLIIDPFKCDLCEACVEFTKRKKCFLNIKPSEEDFIFFIESFGQLKPEEIFVEAINALDDNIKEFGKEVKKIKAK